ncbi:hypothetical protein RAB80_018043 [Fusarium oxysporum f. sp. vasinfectum]|nr:hypothetical protein RAB80_018043 [Fusarium oxysporum f. sp. vasinfectum]
MSAQPDDNLPTVRDGMPLPIAPQKKAAVLISLILISIFEITFGAISVQFIYRHEGYGRHGAWTRPWNEDGVPGITVFNGAISLVIFGSNVLSELHPRHPYYSRRSIILGALAIFIFNWMLCTDAIKSAWHFMSFGREDRDAYWLGVWTVCIITVRLFKV